MKLGRLSILGIIITASCTSAYADPEVYGKINLSFHSYDDGSDSIQELRNNYSRLGFKGEHDIDENLKAIYQYELGITPDESSTFSQRNSFIGIAANWGTVKAGYFDTALKTSQGKVDLFNDMIGDISSVITLSDNRVSDILEYATPVFAGGMQAKINYILSEDPEVDEGVSASLFYSGEKIYLAIAHDTNVEEPDSSAARATAAYNLNGFQIGLIYQMYEPGIGEEEDGILGSIKYTKDKWAFKLQHGVSEIKNEGGESTSFGVDYSATKSFSYTSYITQNKSDDGLDDTYLGFGVVLKF